MVETRRILIVEDSPTFQVLIKSLIKKSSLHVDFNIMVICNAHKAIDYINDHPEYKPDLIISDVSMPGSISGIDFLQFIREHEELNGIPFFIVSASTTHLDEDRAKTLNCTEFLEKPFSINNLYRLLFKWLKLKES